MVWSVFFKLGFNLEYYFKSLDTWPGASSTSRNSAWNIILRVQTHGPERLLQVGNQLGILF
jgi:hypothetical protein